MRARELALALLMGCGGPAAPATPEEPATEPPAEGQAEHAHAAPVEAAQGPLPALPPVPEGARVFFVSPADGEKLVGPLENGRVAISVKMGAEKIAIQPAGQVLPGSGHHHLLIDVEPVPAGEVVPKDEQHLHFGQAQTEASLGIAPGQHTLRLQLADGVHRSYGPTLSATVVVTVAAAGSVEAEAEAAPPEAPTKAGAR